MKEFFTNLCIVVVTVVYMAFVVVWCSTVGIIIGIPTAILLAFKYKKANNIWSWYKETIVWPYKLLGICNDWDGYVDWVRFNL